MFGRFKKSKEDKEREQKEKVIKDLKLKKAQLEKLEKQKQEIKEEMIRMGKLALKDGKLEKVENEAPQAGVPPQAAPQPVQQEAPEPQGSPFADTPGQAAAQIYLELLEELKKDGYPTDIGNPFFWPDENTNNNSHFQTSFEKDFNDYLKQHGVDLQQK